MFQFLFQFFRSIWEIFLVEKQPDFTSFPEKFLDKTEFYHSKIPDCQIDGVFVSFFYTPAFRQALFSFKYHHIRAVGKRFVPYYIHLLQHFSILSSEKILITGVPMSFLPRLRRGYNHTYLLAQDVARALGYSFIPLVKKIKRTEHQANLKRQGRLTNLFNAFQVDPQHKDALPGATVIVIDDVISTGSTMQEMAKVLKTAGASRVIGVFLASEKVDQNVV